MDSVDWMTSGVSFNPYQSEFSPLEVSERERKRRGGREGEC